MKSFTSQVRKFPGKGGWLYVDVPAKYTKELKERRKAWGMYPIRATLGNTKWNTKLMTKKGGYYFIALKAAIRKKEEVELGDRIKIQFYT